MCCSSIDASAAERLPGVVCCLFADSVPGSNVTGIKQDETVFADRQVGFFSIWLIRLHGALDKKNRSTFQVTCVGHIIGAVVANSQPHAQRAAKAVKIEYEELQPVITIQVRHSHVLFNFNHISEDEIPNLFAYLTGSHRRSVLLRADPNPAEWRP